MGYMVCIHRVTSELWYKVSGRMVEHIACITAAQAKEYHSRRVKDQQTLI